MNLHNKISKTISFHNIKNNFWNYFNFSLDLSQNLIFFSSEKNIFEEFRILFEKNKKYQGFITYNDEILNPKKIRVYYDFLTKDSFEKIKDTLIINILNPLWQNEKISLNNKKHIKELSEYISFEIYGFLKNLTSFLLFLDNQTLSSEEIQKKFFQLKNKYKFLHKRILNFYNKKQKIWSNSINKINFLSSKIKEFKEVFLNKILVKIKNKNNFSLVYKSITKNIIDIINTNNNLLKQNNNFDKKNILLLIKLYSLFLKEIWKREEFFVYFNSTQIIYLYKSFQKWVTKSLNKSKFNDYNKIHIFFKQTFYSFFMNFFHKNKQFRINEIYEIKKSKIEYNFNITIPELESKLSDVDTYYENLKLNDLMLEKANLLWHRDEIKTNLKYSNWSALLFWKSKKMIWKINKIIKNIKNQNNKENDFSLFLDYIIKDLDLFFNVFNKNKLNYFLNKSLFYEFCFKNKLNLNLLFTKVEDLNVDDLFYIELIKTKITNFDLLLLNSDSFFFDEKYKNKFVDEFSIFSKNVNCRLFLFEKKPVQFKKNFSAIFIEKGSLIEFKNNLEKQPKFNTFFANYFFNNGNFYMNELGNIKENLFSIMSLNQIRKNGKDVFNTFEKKRLQWSSFDELPKNIHLSIMEKSIEDIKVIKL